MTVSRIVFGITLIAALALTGNANAQAAKSSGGGAKISAGTGEGVKTWKDMTFDQVTAAKRPTLLYIYDTDEKRNVTAPLLEGPKFLADADVKAKESKFLLVKDKMGEGNNYPHDWIQQANGGAALLVLSADGKVIQSFSKTTKEQNTPAALMAAMDAAIKASANVTPGPDPANNNKNAANKKPQPPAKKNG